MKLLLVRGIFLAQEMGIFLLVDRILPPSTGFSTNGRFVGREQGQGSPYMAGATSKMKDDIFLVKWGYMGYNSGQ